MSKVKIPNPLKIWTDTIKFLEEQRECLLVYEQTQQQPKPFKLKPLDWSRENSFVEGVKCDTTGRIYSMIPFSDNGKLFFIVRIQNHRESFLWSETSECDRSIIWDFSHNAEKKLHDSFESAIQAVEDYRNQLVLDGMETEPTTQPIIGDSIQWISVEDQMPESNQTVLCCVGNNEYRQCDFHHHAFWFKELDKWIGVTDQVLFWMPIPECDIEEPNQGVLVWIAYGSGRIESSCEVGDNDYQLYIQELKMATGDDGHRLRGFKNDILIKEQTCDDIESAKQFAEVWIKNQSKIH